MRVLVVDAYPEDHAAGTVVELAIAALESAGNQVDYLSLTGDEFATTMTADERAAYETEQPLLRAETRASAARVQQSDALLFCYPTTLFGVPPRLKSWLERVMVMGVSFVFDEKQRVRPGLTNVRRLGVITTTPHSRRATMRARDLGYRIFMRTLRLNCHPLCRRTFIRMPEAAPSARYADRINRSLRSWKPRRW